MSTVSQSIPNLLSGISQQPDRVKRPGQLKEAVNAFPDFALGLLKRPGGKFVAKLTDATNTGKWFPILRDNQEKYIAQYDNDRFKIWNLLNGNLSSVDMGTTTGQPGACNIANVKAAVTNYNNGVTAERSALTALHAAESDLAKKLEGQFGTTNVLFNTEFDQLSNPQVDSYGDYWRERIHSGAVVAEETQRQATATAVHTSVLTGFTVTNQGEGYVNIPTINISGSGNGATATAVLESLGTFKQLDLTEPGSGYTHRPITSISGGMSDYFSTALMYGFGQPLYGINVDGKKRIDLINNADEIHYRSTGGVTLHGQGSGSGGNNNFKPDIVPPETYAKTYWHFGGADAWQEREMIIKPQDLTNIEKVGVYVFAGSGNNGGRQPTFSYNTSLGTPGNRPIRPHRLIAKFVVKDTAPTTVEWDAAENYLLVDGNHPGGTNGVDPECAVVGDPGLGQAVPGYTHTIDDQRPNRRDITLPSSLKQASVWMKIIQPFFANQNTGWSYNLSNYCLMHIDYIDDRSGVSDSTMTITKNPLAGFSNPSVEATADIVIGKKLASVTLDSPGSGYNVNGQDTAATVIGGFPSVVAAISPTYQSSFTTTITDPGLGYVDATVAVSSGGGTGATGVVTTEGGVVTGITLTEGGNNDYNDNPTLTLSAPNLEGSRPGLTLILKDDVVHEGHLNYVSLKSIGSGFTDGSYTDVPTTTNGTGTGVTVDLTVFNGHITEATINTNGTGYYTGDELYPTGYSGAILQAEGIAVGAEQTDYHPLLASTGFRAFKIEDSIAPQYTAAQVTAAETAYQTAETAYNTAVSNLATLKTAYDTADSACVITSQPNTAYLHGADPEDIELLTLNDYTFVVNKKKIVQMKPDLTHQGGLDANRAHVLIALVAFSSEYIVTLDGTDYSYTTAASGVNADTIASNLASTINAAGYTATAVGPGLYITRSTPFTIATSGSASSEGIFAITDVVENTTRLPAQTKDGYIIRVVNSEDIDIDDMYLEFITDNNAGFGNGHWEESTAPDITYKFDELTMPHQLVNDAPGEFTFAPVDWNDRLVGDDLTNKKPSFVGHTISHVFFYRNRMGFLSGQNVVLSKAGDIFNFWNTSAQAATNDDPIDISAAGKRPAFLNYVEPTAVGLVMYSTNEQFLLTTDSDILAPTSAKVNILSGYECDDKIESVSLGTTQAFVSKTPLYARLFELNDISADAPPIMNDVSAPVPELIPASVNSIVSSPALAVVSLGEIGKSTLYHYRFLAKSRDEKLLQSWYKWELTGTLLSQFFDSSTWYATVANGTDVYVQSYDMTQSSEQGFLTLPTGEKTDVCLDLFDVNPHRTYDAANDKTRIFLGYDSVSGKQLNVLVLGGYIGDASLQSSTSVGAVLQPTIEGNAGEQYVDIDGDFRGRNLIVGYNYDMIVELPTFYRYKIAQSGSVTNDDISSLIVHRLKVRTGLSGPITYQVNITGLDTWDDTISVTQPNQYQLNNVNMQASATHVVPVFQRNENLSVRIVGNTPFPVSLLGLDWEGKLNRRFYRRG
tara:strand:- start:6170 stop:10744 length:4575 start_codon:yes stop_codon:yes gene_type:complete